MRYRFRGLLRETGKAVEGHVEAPTVDQAYDLMADNGIVCEAMREDPRLGDFTSPSGTPAASSGQPGGGATDEFTNAIDSALDTSSTQVNVDDLWRRYRGQKVRVIDRDKIRQRVMNVVTKALQQSVSGKDDRDQTLERVEQALGKMFGDNKNLTSELSPQQVAMEDQINRLNNVVLSMEKSMAQLTMAMRRGGGWGMGDGGSTTRGQMIKAVKDPKNDKVLLEIFETNLKLQRGVKDKPAPGTAPGTSPGTAPGTTPAATEAEKK